MSSHGNKSSCIVDENAAQVRIPDGDSDVDGSLVGGRKSRVAGSFLRATAWTQGCGFRCWIAIGRWENRSKAGWELSTGHWTRTGH